jgi:hypothetical protein
MSWVGFNHAFISVFSANVLICKELFKKKKKTNKHPSLHPFAAQRHVQFGTRCQRELEGLVGYEGYDQSK